MRHILCAFLNNSDSITCLAALTKNELLWKRGVSVFPGEAERIDLREVVFVCSVDTLRQQKSSGKSVRKLTSVLGCQSDSGQAGFVVSHITRAENHKWKTRETIFWCSSKEEAEKWISKLNESISNVNPLRPHHLLIFLNPNAGHRKAVHIYEDVAEPLFRLARIKTDIIVTTHRGHVTEYLLANNLDNYDGVICVGGDGFLAEAVQGVLLRERINANLPLHSEHLPGSVEVPSSTRLGIIPAGSTDTVVFSTQGTNDVLTSVLHIIIGDDLPLDIAAIHSGDDGSFVRYGMSLIGYGFHADLLKNDDKLRWMGPKRYDCAGVSTFLAHSVYTGEISYLPSANRNSHSKDRVLCSSGCSVCSLNVNTHESRNSLPLSTNVVHPHSVEVLPSSPKTNSMNVAEPTHVRQKSVNFYLESDPLNTAPAGSPSRASTMPRRRNHTKYLVSDSASNNLLLSVDQRYRPQNSLRNFASPPSPSSSEDSGFHQPTSTAPILHSCPSWSIQGCENGWKTFTGQFIAINAFLQSCRCVKAASGPSPWTHLGDGCLDLILVKKCTRKQFLQFLIRTAKGSDQLSSGRGLGQASPFDLPFVRVERVCAFEFKGVSSLSRFPSSTSIDSLTEITSPLQSDDPDVSDRALCSCSSNCRHKRGRHQKAAESESIWCADGELVPHTNVAVFVHRHLVRLFARGPEPLCQDALAQPLADRQTQWNELFNSIVSTLMGPDARITQPNALMACTVDQNTCTL